jgi:hypothetical protein
MGVVACVGRSETARGQENQIDRMSVRSAAGKAAEPTPSKCKAPWRCAMPEFSRVHTGGAHLT